MGNFLLLPTIGKVGHTGLHNRNFMMVKLNTVFFILVFVTLLHPGTSRSEVVDSTSFGFTVRHEQILPLAAETLFVIFYRDIGKWWDPDHTWSGNTANLSIEPFANGCFCEKLSIRNS
jgi:hypothetical protein